MFPVDHSEVEVDDTGHASRDVSEREGRAQVGACRREGHAVWRERESVCVCVCVCVRACVRACVCVCV